MTTAAVQDLSQTFLVSTFYVGDALCGVDTTVVQEVIQIGDVTTVHHAPDCILGIINLRGKIVTVIDLGRKLDLPQSTISDESRVFIVEWKDEYIGLVVDKVADVVSAERDKLLPSPANVTGMQGRYFEGIYQTATELIAVLNIDVVLQDEGD